MERKKIKQVKMEAIYILKVPIGTQVFEEDNKTLIYDFKKEKEEFVVANGGKGGLGNTRFKSSTNRAPRKFTKGNNWRRIYNLVTIKNYCRYRNYWITKCR